MKKSLALLLALALALALAVPAMAAPESSAAPSDTPAPTPAPVVESEIAKSMVAPKCKAAVLLDDDTGEILYDFNSHVQNYPASITKVMTAFLTLEAVERGELGLERVITASESYGYDLIPGGSTQNIKPGEELTVHELLYCALVPSANEACNILAETVAGSGPKFVELMNARAQELGMVDTHFVNAHGLPDPNHYTTAYDLALLVREAMKNATFREIVATKTHTVPATNLSPKRVFGNTNALISASHFDGYLYSKAVGVKTGSTSAAGQCLASAAVDDDKLLICVVLGAENVENEDGAITRNSFAESKRLLQWGFDSFKRVQLIDMKAPVKEIPVTLSAEATVIPLKPQEGLEATLFKDMDPDAFQRDITVYYESVEAPVTAGQILGEMTVRNGDTVYGTVKLVAGASAERSELLYRLDQAKQFFSNFWVRVGLVVLGVLILVLLIRFAFAKPKNNYSGRRR